MLFLKSIDQVICSEPIFNFDMENHYPEIDENYFSKEPLVVSNPLDDKIHLFQDVVRVKKDVYNSFLEYLKMRDSNVKG